MALWPFDDPVRRIVSLAAESDRQPFRFILATQGQVSCATLTPSFRVLKGESTGRAVTFCSFGLLFLTPLLG
jgi:hypothetical protein